MLNLQKFCGAVGDLTFALVGVFGLPQWLDGKESAFNAGDVGSIPGWGRSPGGGHGNPLQYSCLEIPWTEEPGGLQSRGLQKSRTRLSDLAHTHGASVYSVETSRSRTPEPPGPTSSASQTWLTCSMSLGLGPKEYILCVAAWSSEDTELL